MVLLCPLLGALYFGLLPELDAMRTPEIRGEIVFRKPRPATSPTDHASSGTPVAKGGGSMDWLLDRYEQVMSWEHNPWKTAPVGFGGNYWKLLESKDPKDQARARELRRLAEALHRRVLERYPELAAPDKNVPPERNGFLKWLEFAERFEKDAASRGSTSLPIPGALLKHLDQAAPWDAAAAKAWLSQEKVLLDEIRAIGLMPEQSIAGIDIDRYAFMPARLAKSAADALLLDARLAAEEGNVEGALDSLRAAIGLATHFSQVETPSLLAVTVQILLQHRTQSYALSDIMPALPPGRLDPAAWESAARPEVVAPDEYARIMRGEWNVTARQYLLPMLCDTEDPKYPQDPDALIDQHAGYFTRIVQAYEGHTVSEWPDIAVTSYPDDSHLSRSSREATAMLFIGERAWSEGLVRAQSATALTQAAFAVMNGGPLPLDPIHGLPYRWDAATRTLSAPDSPVFAEMGLKPLLVPRP
jgi:hypothetical protein